MPHDVFCNGQIYIVFLASKVRQQPGSRVSFVKDRGKVGEQITSLVLDAFCCDSGHLFLKVIARGSVLIEQKQSANVRLAWSCKSNWPLHWRAYL